MTGYEKNAKNKLNEINKNVYAQLLQIISDKNNKINSNIKVIIERRRNMLLLLIIFRRPNFIGMLS